MRKILTYSLLPLLSFVICLGQPTSEAAEDENYSITITPGKYIWVDGDVNKFRAQNWINNNYTAGIKNLNFSKEFDKDSTLNFEGHLFPDENDNAALIDFTSKDIGTFNFEYDSFRKYYDNSGGYYYPFTTFPSIDAPRELDMDIEKLLFSFSPTLGIDDTGLTFSYERHTKDGDKSRLTWAEVVEGATARETSPSWQSIDETVDIFTLKADTIVSGINLSAEQSYEQMDTKALRYERWYSTNNTASQKKQRFQDQQPETQIYTTTLQGNKWFDDDTVYTNIAYRYSSLSNHELENITETDENGIPANYGSPKTRVNAMADNDVDNHTLVAHYMKLITPTLKVTAKSKNNIMKRQGESTYPYDTTSTPDGVIDAIDYSQSRNKLLLFGQNFAVQYTGLKNTSIYSDIELTEMKNDLNEIQLDIDRIFKWQRITERRTQKAVYTLGGRYVPSRKVNMTLQARHRYENNDYDDKVDTEGAINSAFFDSLRIVGDEVTTKLTWKPMRWLQNSFRYQFDTKRYDSRVQNLLDISEGRYNSHTFTYDMFVQPTENFLVNFAYTIQDAKTSTPAAASTNVANLPGFNADVQSFLISSSYTPNEETNYTTSFGLTTTDNFNDFTSTELPLGSSNSYYVTECSMQYKPKNKDWTVEPHYAYYRYDTSSVAEFGDYTAHVTWVDFSLEW